MFEPSTFDEQARTVEMVFATGTPVYRMDWWTGEGFDEVLDLAPKSVRLERLNSGAPFLKDHSGWSIDNVVGVVERAWVEDGKGKAVIRFADTEDVKPILQKVKDGILRNVSVGYKVHKYEKKPKGESEVRAKYTAIDWEPYEISMVAIPADHKSQLRSEEGDTHFITIQTRDSDMETNQNPVPPTPTVDVEAAKREAAQEAAKAERQRIATINDMVRKMDLGEEFASKLVSENISLDQARELIINEAAERSAANKITNNGGGDSKVTGKDEVEKRREGIIASLAMRSSQLDQKEFSEEEKAYANKYRRMGLMDLATDALKRAGYTDSQLDGLTKMEIVGRAFTSSQSDFPVLLEGTNRRILLANYRIQADTWRRFCAVGSVNDFREYKRLRMGSFSDLDLLAEGQEYKTKKITDADYEKVSVRTKGNMINVTRQMIVNDDLAAFTRLAAMLGRAAARSIENDVYALLLSNSGNGPNLVDGNPIFHANHNNIVAAGAMSATQIEAGRVLMAMQKEKDGNDYLDIRPSILICTTALGAQARIYNDAQYDVDVTSKFQVPNKVRGLFNDVIDTPRIPSDAQFYMFADPNIEPVLEVNFLQGIQEPFMESQNGWNIDGTEWKIRLDYGVGAVGFRGAVKVPKA